jgi:hypothetical protein
LLLTRARTGGALSSPSDRDGWMCRKEKMMCLRRRRMLSYRQRRVAIGGRNSLNGCVQGDILYHVSLFSGQSVIMRLLGDAARVSMGHARFAHVHFHEK